MGFHKDQLKHLTAEQLMLLTGHLDRAGRCKDAARLAVDAAKRFAAEGRAALQKRCDRFKPCQKSKCSSNFVGLVGIYLHRSYLSYLELET